MISRNEETDQDATTKPTSKTANSSISLSKYSFRVADETINVEDPELNIGTVEGDSLQIDAEKQSLQDQFMKNMNKKFKDKFKQNL